VREPLSEGRRYLMTKTIDREEAASNAYATSTLLATATASSGAAATVRRYVRAAR
jgi:hypothetical protein